MCFPLLPSSITSTIIKILFKIKKKDFYLFKRERGRARAGADGEGEADAGLDLGTLGS